MNNQKRSFVLYFDACEELNDLPPDQRGWVLSALNEFAQRCAEDVKTDGKAVLEHYPALLPENHMACLVRFESIRRDTRRWNRQQTGGSWSSGRTGSRTGGGQSDEAWQYVR